MPEVPEILTKAADVISKRGWAHDDYAAPNGAVCPRAALAVAADHNPLFSVDWPEYCTVINFGDDGYGTDAERAAHADITSAEAAFARYLRDQAYDDGFDDQVLIERWNDEDDRTAEQVTTALRECAAELAKGAKA